MPYKNIDSTTAVSEAKPLVQPWKAAVPHLVDYQVGSFNMNQAIGTGGVIRLSAELEAKK